MNKTPTRAKESRVEHEGPAKSATLKRSYVSRPARLIEVKDASNDEDVVKTEEMEIPEVPVAEPDCKVQEDSKAETVVDEEPVQEEKTVEVEPVAKIAHFAPMTEQPGIPMREPEESPRDAKRILETVKIDEEPIKPAVKHPIQKATAKKVAKKPVSRKYLSAKEMKDAAIEKALREVQEEQDVTLAQAMSKERKRKSRNKFIIAFAASAACIGVLGYFVSLRVPDISLKVAAMQTGIDAAYPSYVPRDYKLSGVSAENDGRIVMSFEGPSGYSFTLTEEKSSWDTRALLNNYVKKNWNADYDVVRESGLTIYISHSDAVWLNAGKMFVIDASANNLTKKQIKNIAISL